MTEQEKQEAIKDLQNSINGLVGFLVTLRGVARENGSEDIYPIFNDMTITNLLDRYEQLKSLRGW